MVSIYPDCPECGENSWADLGCSQCGLEFFPPSEAFQEASSMTLTERIAEISRDERAAAGLGGRSFLSLSTEQKAVVERFAKLHAHTALRPSNCQHLALRGYVIIASGQFSPREMCLRCGLLNSIRTFDRVPLFDICFRDNRHEYGIHECAHCGTGEGTEYHHWAPRAIFNDANSWPGSYLCPGCHRAWHAAMREAAGYRLPERRRIGEYRRGYWRKEASRDDTD